MKKVSTLAGIIIIVAVAIIAFGGVFAYQYFTKPQQNSEFFGSSPKTTQIQTQTANYFEIKELGLKFKIIDDIKDLVYLIKDYSPETNSRSVLFSTKSLASTGGYCSVSEAPLGVLGISQKRSTGEIAVSYLIESNNLYVSYMGPQAACSDVKAIQDLQTKQLNSLRQALKTITKISN